MHKRSGSKKHGHTSIIKTRDRSFIFDILSTGFPTLICFCRFRGEICKRLPIHLDLLFQNKDKDKNTPLKNM